MSKLIEKLKWWLGIGWVEVGSFTTGHMHAGGGYTCRGMTVWKNVKTGELRRVYYDDLGW